MPTRKVTRSIHEAARDAARDIATTDAYVVSRRERKKVEMPFAHLKRILKLDRLRLRVPTERKTNSTSPPSSEPPQNGQKDPDAGGRTRLIGSGDLLADMPLLLIVAEHEFFNRIGPERDIARDTVRYNSPE